ncbi:MAG: DUF1804 family protein [Magnetococcales bacterium]|nr:DUF1804 family protein [Magnetococcales bacterium]
MDHQELRKQLIRHEGMRLKPYRCTAGKLTIGVGRNLDDRSITKSEAYVLLDADIKNAVVGCLRPADHHRYGDHQGQAWRCLTMAFPRERRTRVRAAYVHGRTLEDAARECSVSLATARKWRSEAHAH